MSSGFYSQFKPKIMSYTNILILISICALSFGCTDNKKAESRKQTPTENQKKAYDNLFDIGNDNFIICSTSDIAEGKSISIDLDNDGIEEVLSIGLNHPNGFRILGIKNGCGIHLLAKGCENAYDEFQDLNEGYYVQVSHVDLDNDGIHEVLVSLGDKLTEMVTAIYKICDTEDDPFKLIGTLDGQSKMYLKDNHIIIPIGSQGLYDEYIYDRIFEAME